MVNESLTAQIVTLRMFPVDARPAARLDKSMAVAQLAKILFEMQDAPVLVGLGDRTSQSAFDFVFHKAQP
jgi:hypothetical protein